MYKGSAIFIGALIAIMVTFNGVLAGYLGNYQSIFVVNIVGLIAVSLILIIKRKRIKLNRHIPIYLYTAGAIGVFLVFFNNLNFNYLGVSLTLSIGLLGQSITSGVIDHYGLFGMEVHKFHKEKLFGFLLISIGIAIMIFF